MDDGRWTMDDAPVSSIVYRLWSNPYAPGVGLRYLRGVLRLRRRRGIERNELALALLGGGVLLAKRAREDRDGALKLGAGTIAVACIAQQRAKPPETVGRVGMIRPKRGLANGQRALDVALCGFRVTLPIQQRSQVVQAAGG